MLERNRESNLAWSRVQGKSIEVFNGSIVNKIEKIYNPESLMQAVLKNRGFDSLVQMYLEKDNPRKIPVDILREIVLVDSLDVDPVTKTKLAIYRVWAQDGHYSRVKEYFPETSFGLEQIQTTLSGRNRLSRTKPLEEYVNEVMMDEGELGRNYNSIHYRAEIIDKLLPWTYGLIYIRKFELLAKIINEVTPNITKKKISKEAIEQIISKYEREVVDLEHRLRSETRLEKVNIKKPLKKIHEENQNLELKQMIFNLWQEGKSKLEISKTLGITLGRIDFLLYSDIIIEYRRQKMKIPMIAYKLDIDKSKVNNINRGLILLGTIEPTGNNKERVGLYKHFCTKVLELRSKGFNTSSISRELNVKERKVKKALEVLNEVGWISPRWNKGSKIRSMQYDEFREKIKTLWESGEEISIIASTLSVPVANIKHHLWYMRKRNMIKSRR